MFDQLANTCRTRLDIMGSAKLDFFKKNKAPFFLPHIICVDGTEISVQANKIAYCYPQSDEGPYTHVEVGFLQSSHTVKDLPPEWTDYEYDRFIYGHVPIQLVMDFINAHGGIRTFGPIQNVNRWR